MLAIAGVIGRAELVDVFCAEGGGADTTVSGPDTMFSSMEDLGDGCAVAVVAVATEVCGAGSVISLADVGALAGAVTIWLCEDAGGETEM